MIHAPARIAVEAAGVYVLPDGDIIKVKANKEKTRTYGMIWNAERTKFEYQQGLIEDVVAEGRQMNLDEAKAFALKFGECVRCGRTLTDPKSIERALGPVCVKYFQSAPAAPLAPAPAGKTYTAWCHVGEHLHTFEAHFFSSGVAKVIDDVTFPVCACKEHNEAEAVRAAYLTFTGQDARTIPGNGLSI